MNPEKLKKQKKTHLSILFTLYAIFIIFLFYLAYQFINNQLEFEVAYIIFPVILVSVSVIPLSQILSINKKLKG